MPPCRLIVWERALPSAFPTRCCHPGCSGDPRSALREPLCASPAQARHEEQGCPGDSRSDAVAPRSKARRSPLCSAFCPWFYFKLPRRRDARELSNVHDERRPHASRAADKLNRMKILTYEGVVERGEVKLAKTAKLLEHAKVYVVVPGVEDLPPFMIHTPRLLRPEQAADFAMEIVEGDDSALR